MDADHDLDRELAAAITPGRVPPSFRAAVRARIGANQRPAWLPEVLDAIGLLGATVAIGALFQASFDALGPVVALIPAAAAVAWALRNFRPPRRARKRCPVQ